MSKYILKKDLPFAKAGDEINLTNEMLDHNCVCDALSPGNTSLPYSSYRSRPPCSLDDSIEGNNLPRSHPSGLDLV